MKHISVSSTSLSSVGYDVRSKILEIKFNNGSTYKYFNVPEMIYEALMKADSHGKYFDSKVKKGGYRYERVR
jgi:KTSC domain